MDETTWHCVPTIRLSGRINNEIYLFRYGKKTTAEKEDAAEFRKVFRQPLAEKLYQNTINWLSPEKKARIQLANEEKESNIRQAFDRGDVGLGTLLYQDMIKELPQEEIKEANRNYSFAWTNTHNSKITGFKEFMESRDANGGDLYVAWMSVHETDEGFADYLKILVEIILS